jgi:hypothetical protein
MNIPIIHQNYVYLDCAIFHYHIFGGCMMFKTNVQVHVVNGRQNHFCVWEEFVKVTKLVWNLFKQEENWILFGQDIMN